MIALAEYSKRIADTITESGHSTSIASFIQERIYKIAEEIFHTICLTASKGEHRTSAITYFFIDEHRCIISDFFNKTFNIITTGIKGEEVIHKYNSVMNFSFKGEKTYKYEIFFLWSATNQWVHSLEPFADLAIRLTSPIPEPDDLPKHNDDFYQAALEKDETDVTFKVGSEEFPAHRLFFKRKAKDYFEPLLKRFAAAEEPVVEIKNVEAITFREIHRFVYTGSVKKIEDLQELLALYEQAHAYQIDGLMKLVNHRLNGLLSEHPTTTETFPQVLRAACQTDNAYLIHQCCLFTEKAPENSKLFMDSITKLNYAVVSKHIDTEKFKKLSDALLKKSAELFK